MEKSKPTIKLLVCYHKPDKLLKDDIMTPIHVGRAIAKKNLDENDPKLQWMLQNMIGDDSGDNISVKNSSYNELTALYWAWKNYDLLGNPDYIGLMHYRRHFIFRPSDRVVENYPEMDNNYLDLINYNQETLGKLFDDCDYVAHVGHVDKVSKHYEENHHIEDLNLALKILKRKYPKFAKTADDFMKMSDVNFCNMFIFPKAIFFDYCSWIFDILDEFEKVVDLSEKRLFISERLTGIYIEYLRRRGYKQKSLSTTFIGSVVHVPVVLPYNGESIFRTAVTIQSILKNAEEQTSVDFYILYRKNEYVNKEAFNSILRDYDGHSISYIEIDTALKNKNIDIEGFNFPEHYPLVVPELLEGVNKALYFDERALFLGDIAQFYQTCNNDEFYVIGLPKGKGKLIEGQAYSLNCARLRKHNFLQKASAYTKEYRACEIFNICCEKQVSSFAWWIYTLTSEDKDGGLIYPKYRREIQYNDIRPLIYFEDGMEPWANIQGLYSIHWWRVAKHISKDVPFDCITDSAKDLMQLQSEKVCELVCSKKYKKMRRQYKNHMDSGDYKFLTRKVIDYCKRYGIRQTVRRCIQKIWRIEK